MGRLCVGHAVGDLGKIIHWNGTEWLAQASGTTSQLSAVWGSGPADAYAVGANGTVLHYNGTAWSPVSIGSSVHLTGVWGTSASDVFISGEQGELFHRDAVGRWSPVRSQTTFAVAAISGSGDNVMWIDGEGAVHQLTRTFSW